MAKLRMRAANGNESIRLGIAKLPDLDQKTLEILARRGPDSVRLEVANHPCLTEEVARLLRRYGGAEIEATLRERFAERSYEAGASSKVEPVPVDEAVRSTPDVAAAVPVVQPPLVEPEWAMSEPEPTPAEPEPSSAEPDGASVDPLISPVYPLFGSSSDLPNSAPDPQPLAVPDDEPRPVDDLPAFGPAVASPYGYAAGPEPVPLEPDPAADLMAFIDEVERGLDLLETESDGTALGSENAPTKDRYDESAEIRFVEVFERFPSGKAGEMLLERLATGRHAPKFRQLIELRDAGLDVEEISITWAVREYWNESRTVSHREFPLDYKTVGRLVHAYPSIPDVEEVLGVLELLEQRWASTGCREGRTLSEYIRASVAAYESAVRSGGYTPLELLLN